MLFNAPEVKTENPVLLLTAFGSTIPETQVTYKKIETAIRRAFPENRVEWAFTSTIVRAKLKKTGVNVYSTNEMLSRLKSEGLRNFIIQSLHVAPGEEFEQLSQSNMNGISCQIGAPLLSCDTDIVKMANIITKLVPKNQPTIIAAHGNKKYPQFNEVLIKFGKLIESKNNNVVLCTLEGLPGTEPMSKLSSLVKEFGSIHFIPLLMVAGTHVMNDFLGNHSSSWKNQINADTATVSAPIGENSDIHNMIIDHINCAIEHLKTRG